MNDYSPFLDDNKQSNTIVKMGKLDHLFARCYA